MLSLELNAFLHGGSADATESLLILTRADHGKRLIIFGAWNRKAHRPMRVLAFCSNQFISLPWYISMVWDSCMTQYKEELIGQQHFCQPIKSPGETLLTKQECSFPTSPFNISSSPPWVLVHVLLDVMVSPGLG